MNSLILATGSHYGREWSGDDFVVLRDGEVVGRIMLHPQAPKEQRWFWTITSLEMPPSVYNRGYAATCEQAMADFKARWVART
jgi:hypothetical protein